MRQLPLCLTAIRSRSLKWRLPWPRLWQVTAKTSSRKLSLYAVLAVLAGSAHYGISRGNERDPESLGILRFLHFERGRRAIGQALLEAVEDDLRRQQIDRINVFPQSYRYRFYSFNHAYLSVHLDHVEALLGYNGYEKVGGEVFLDSVDYRPDPPKEIDLQFDIALEWIDGQGERQDLTLRAANGDTQLGECQSVSCQTFSRTEALKDWHFCNWLAVEEEVQGKGLGRFLLQQARFELHKVGYRHAGISTAWKNYRASAYPVDSPRHKM